jgi:hypothetical protein
MMKTISVAKLFSNAYSLHHISNSTEGVTKFSNNIFSVCLEKIKIIFILSLVFDLLESRNTLKKERTGIGTLILLMLS